MKPTVYSNVIIYQQLVHCLKELLHDKVLYNAFSTGKDQLFFGFKSKIKKDFTTLECRFVNGEILYFISNDEALIQAKRGLAAFKNIHEETVVNFVSPSFERHFMLNFSNGASLLFKGYGRFSNIILFEKNAKQIELENVFRKNIKADYQASLDQYLEEQQLSNEQILTKFAYTSLLKPYAELDKDAFISKIVQNLNATINAELNADQCIEFELKENAEKTVNIVENLNFVGSNYASSYFFRTEKNALLANTVQQIKKLKAGVRDSETRLLNLEKRRSFREIGDIILAYASSIGPGVSNALLPDLYLGGKITVKLNPLQTVSENAERYYKKEQNAKIETEMLLERIEKTKLNLATQLEKEIQINEALDIRSLRSVFGKKKQKDIELKPVQTSSPYKEFEFEGTKIWVGKSAKSNDEMLKMAHRNDIWMHARNVQGSHVIIKTLGKPISAKLLNYAAGLAAFHSKAKTQEIVPVQYVERKFVSKPKNSNAGEVSLIKEQIIDAEPLDGKS